MQPQTITHRPSWNKNHVTQPFWFFKRILVQFFRWWKTNTPLYIPKIKTTTAKSAVCTQTGPRTFFEVTDQSCRTPLRKRKKSGHSTGLTGGTLDEPSHSGFFQPNMQTVAQIGVKGRKKSTDKVFQKVFQHQCKNNWQNYSTSKNKQK